MDAWHMVEMVHESLKERRRKEEAARGDAEARQGIAIGSH